MLRLTQFKNILYWKSDAYNFATNGCIILDKLTGGCARGRIP